MKQRHKHISTTALSKNPSVSVMVSWMHNNASDINDIGREYNHGEHRGTQRIDLKTLCSLCPLWLNPVAFTACVGSIRLQQISVDLLDSCHSFIRVIRDKISTKRSRMVTNDANCTNVRTWAHYHKIRVFSLEFSIVPSTAKNGPGCFCPEYVKR